MEDQTATAQAVDEPDPFAEPVTADAPPADLPPAPPAEEPIQEPEAEVAQPPAEGTPSEAAPVAPTEPPTDAEPEFVPDGPEAALPGEGEDRPTGDEPDGPGDGDNTTQPAGTAPADPAPDTGLGDPNEGAAATQPPAPADATQPAPQAAGKKERDYALLEKLDLKTLVTRIIRSELVDGPALEELSKITVYAPIHEVGARNQETAINRTFGPNGPHGREFEGDVATLPKSHLETKHVKVGTRTTTAVEIH